MRLLDSAPSPSGRATGLSPNYRAGFGHMRAGQASRSTAPRRYRAHPMGCVARRLGLILLVMAWAAGPAQAAGFQAGAARATTTPPAAGTPAGAAADHQFAGDWATCPSAAFPDRGDWALQEPFKDQN